MNWNKNSGRLVIYITFCLKGKPIEKYRADMYCDSGYRWMFKGFAKWRI